MGMIEAIAAIQRHVGDIRGITQAPESPPDKAAKFPFAVTYASRGTVTSGTAGVILTDEEHVLITEIHVSRSSGLAHAIREALTYHDKFLLKLQGDPQLGGAVETISQVEYEFTGLIWAGIETVGWRFSTSVTIDRC